MVWVVSEWIVELRQATLPWRFVKCATACTHDAPATDRTTAIYATTDYAAIAAIHAAHGLQLRVPEDVEVVGIGNTTEGERMNPALTTVGPLDFFDGVAAFLLDRAVDNESPARLLEFPWQLIVRDSAPR